MSSFEVHSSESACRKSGRLGLEQVLSGFFRSEDHVQKKPCLSKGELTQARGVRSMIMWDNVPVKTSQSQLFTSK